MYRHYIENRITKWGNVYSFCGFCNQVIMSQNRETLQWHMNSKKHKRHANSCLRNKAQKTCKLREMKSLSEEKCSLLVNHNIYFKNKTYFCNYCCQVLSQFSKAKKHIAQNRHNISLNFNYKELFNSGISFKTNFYFCQFCQRAFQNANESVSHTDSKKHLKMVSQKNQIEPHDEIRLRCKVCNCNLKVILIYKHIKSKTHILNLNYSKSQNKILSNNNVMKVDGKNSSVKSELVGLLNHNQSMTYIECSENEMTVLQSFLKEIEENLDLQNYDLTFAENYIVLENQERYHCRVCNEKYHSTKILQHIFGAAHLQGLHKLNEEKNKLGGINRLFNQSEHCYCKKCAIYFPMSEILIQYHSLFHLYREHLSIHLDIIKCNLNERNIDFTCILCNFQMQNNEDLKDHVKSVSHLQKLQLNLFVKSQNQKENLSTSVFHRVQSGHSHQFDPKTDLQLDAFCLSCYEPIRKKNSPIYGFTPKLNLQCFGHQNILSKNQLMIKEYNINFYKCFLCDKSFNEKNLLFEHCKNDLTHQYRFSNFFGVSSENLSSKTEPSGSKKESDKSIIEKFSEKVELIKEQENTSNKWFFMTSEAKHKNPDDVNKQISEGRKEELDESMHEEDINSINKSSMQNEISQISNESNIDFEEDENIPDSIKSVVVNPYSRNEIPGEIEEKNEKQEWSEYFHCKVCEDYFQESKMGISYLQSHCMYHLYKDHPDLNDDIVKISFDGLNFLIKCLICNTVLESFGKFQNHLELLGHVGRVKNLLITNIINNISNDHQTKSKVPSKVELACSSETFDPSTHLSFEGFCSMCYTFDRDKENGHFYNPKYVPLHQHEINKKTWWAFQVQSIQKFYFFKCYLCDESFADKEALFKHYETDLKHKHLFTTFHQLYLVSDQTEKHSAVETSSIENVEPNQIHSTKTNEDVVLKTPISLAKTNNNTMPQIPVFLTTRNNEIIQRMPISSTARNKDFFKLSPIIPRRKPNKTVAVQTLISSICTSKDEQQTSIPPQEAEEVKTQTAMVPAKKPDENIALQGFISFKESDEGNKQHTLTSLIKRNEDIEKYGTKFFSMCIESGAQNIYTFSRKEIDLIQFGISLIFPYKNEGMCIPCSFMIKSNLKDMYKHLHQKKHIKNIKDLRSCKVCENNNFCRLDLIKAGFIEDPEKGDFKCLLCNLHVSKDDYENVASHVLSKTHIRKIKLWKDYSETLTKEFLDILKDCWYYVLRFYCAICKLEVSSEIDFIKHLEQSSHVEKVKLVEKDHRVNKCLACHSCWYGVANAYQEHCKGSFHKNPKKHTELVPKLCREACKLLIFPRAVLANLATEIIKAITTDEKNVEKLLLDVEDTVKSIYPKAKAHFFGSRSFYLGFFSCDLDIFLDCENIYSEIGSKEDSQMYINKVKNLFLLDQKDIWEYETVLMESRVPVIKVEHKPTRLKCDISFFNGLGVEKSRLIRKFVIKNSECREVIMYLKKWFDTVNLYGSHAVNAYVISWLVVFYLQVKNVLPSVCELVEKKNESKLVGGWECGFANVNYVRTQTTFKNLLSNFFFFYAKFDYHHNLICPYLGKVVEKKDFVKIEDLPKEMSIYKDRFKADDLEHFRYDSPFCVQDPVDLSLNLTKAVTKIQLKQFRQYCQESFEKLHI